MKAVYSFLLCICLFGCQPNTHSNNALPEVVKFERATVNSLKEFFKSIEIIRLDHQGEIVIGPMPNLVHHDSSFYMIDQMGTSQIYRFSEKGDFLNTIGQKGRGPEEYEYLQDCYICENSNDIYIQSFPDISILRYDKTGQFIGRKTTSGFGHNFTIIDDRYWIYAGFNNGYQPEQVILSDTNLQILGKYLPINTTFPPTSIGSAFSQGDKHTYLFMPFRETIYEVTHDTIFPAIQFDFGDLNVPGFIWSSEPMKAFDDLSNRGFITVRNITENKNYLIAIFNSQKGQTTYDNHYFCGIKHKKTGKWDWVKQPIDEKNGPIDWFAIQIKGFTKDGRLIIYVPAYQMDKWSLEDHQLFDNPEILENADPEMDMFLLLCTLK